jgi:hypothetical protein
VDGKDDWPASRRRYEAYWNRAVVDRCLFAVTAPRRGRHPAPEQPPADAAGLLAWWTDPAWILRRALARFERTWFGGDAFPQVFLGLGAVTHATYFRGARWHHDHETLWHAPIVEDWDIAPLAFDPGSVLYARTEAIARNLVDEARGRFFVSGPDGTGDLDALVQLRGTERLLIDLLERPGTIQRELRKVHEAWEGLQRRVFDIIRVNDDGGSTIGWMSAWAPGHAGVTQCDLAPCLSPSLFGTFAVPEMERKLDVLEYPVYHLDGVEQERHLDHILARSRLRVVQWTCVYGQPSPVEVLPVLRRIQAAGKGLLMMVEKRLVEPLLRGLSSRGLFLITEAATEDEGRDLVKLAAKLTHD